MTLDELEKRYLPQGATSPQGWGNKVWILDRDLAMMIKALKNIKTELSADGDFEEMWPLSAAAFDELEQP